MKLRNSALLSLTFSCVLLGQSPQRPHITGVAHIALYAHDFEKSRTFYREMFGLEEPYSLQNPDGSASMTFSKINERQYIELFPEKAPATDRLNHIALETDDIESLRRYLALQNVTVPATAAKGRIGNLNFNITDPAGHTVELVQYTPESWTVREKGKYLSPGRISQRMMHVGIIATELEPEEAFYANVLGFSETWRGSQSGSQLSWVNSKVPYGSDYVEFMLYDKAPEPARRGTAHHLCLEVPDISAAVAAIEAKPYFKEYGKPVQIRVGKNRKRQANLFDPDGTRIELMEPVTVDGQPAASWHADQPSSIQHERVKLKTSVPISSTAQSDSPSR